MIEAGRKRSALLSRQELHEIEDDYCQIDIPSVEEEFEPIFLSLHRLSSEYRNIFVDYYMGEMSVKRLSLKYMLPETTIKWRLNVGREKIRKWIGEERMDKVYQRINWNSRGCNGSMDSDRYLHTQIARAICRAAYEKPLSVEEISSCTGIPAMYIEDEIPRLEYGEALRRTGNKYVTDFIIFRLADRACIEEILEPAAKKTADWCEKVLWGRDEELKKIGFYGCERGMEGLGYIFVPFLLRKRIRQLKNARLNLPDGNFPPRKDGGYGWFHILETKDEREQLPEYTTGCNCNSDAMGHGYYYWIAKYPGIWQNGGMGWMLSQGIVQKCPEGIIPENLLKEDDILRLLEANLIRKGKKGYELNFARFTAEQFREICGLFHSADEELDEMLCERILAVKKGFEKFVPKHLHAQINQWVTSFFVDLVSWVAEELIRRGVLAKPDPEKPFADGVFYVAGEYIEP